MVVKLHWKTEEFLHARVTVFVGKDKDHLANCGELTFHREEAKEFRISIRQGTGLPFGDGFSGILESGWPLQEFNKEIEL